MPEGAIVTGGAAGIGFAIAHRLVRAGYDVAVADVDAAGAERAARGFRQQGRRSVGIPCDVGDREAAFSMVETATRALGEVGLLVNNAGIARLGILRDFPEADWKELFRVNVDSVFHCCQAVLPGMMARKQGNIVSIASWNGSSAHRTSAPTVRPRPR